MSLELIISIIGVIVVVLGFVATYFGFISKIQDKISDISKELGKVSAINFEGIFNRLNTIETKIGNANLLDMAIGIAAMKVKTDILWSAVDPILKDLIKQPIHYKKDDLIDRFPNLTEEEMCELREILVSEMKDLVKEKRDKVLAYALFLARIDTTLFDRDQLCAPK